MLNPFYFLYLKKKKKYFFINLNDKKTDFVWDSDNPGG